MDEQKMPTGQKTTEVSSGTNSQNKLIAAAAVVIIIIAGVVYFSQKSSAPAQLKPDGIESQSGEVKTFNLSAKPFEFSAKEIRVKKGDRVKINLTVEQGMHDWVVDEFNARTSQLKIGESGAVEFVADKTGTFEYYCSVLNHRQMGMVGKLIVE